MIYTWMVNMKLRDVALIRELSTGEVNLAEIAGKI
jgi:hypothetical protein